MSEPLPCRKCGRESVVSECDGGWPYYETEAVFVTCTRCDNDGPEHREPEDAIAAWNVLVLTGKLPEPDDDDDEGDDD